MITIKFANILLKYVCFDVIGSILLCRAWPNTFGLLIFKSSKIVLVSIIWVFNSLRSFFEFFKLEIIDSIFVIISFFWLEILLIWLFFSLVWSRNSTIWL